MDAPYQATPDVHVLPTSMAIPGVGVLTINAYVLLAEEPVLIDAGIAVESEEFVEALSPVMASPCHRTSISRGPPPSASTL